MPRSLAAGLFLTLGLGAVACESLPTIPNAAPTASFIFSPVSPIFAGGTSVVFNASASLDTDGHVASYLWNFGDGTAEVTSASPTTVHVFPDTAARCTDIVYAVLLTVTDDKGSRGFASQNVTVTELPAPTSAECATSAGK